MEHLYRKLYSQLKKRPFRRMKGGKDELAVFSPVVGKTYGWDGGVRLMWIGRAVNRWTTIDLEEGESVFLEKVLDDQKKEDGFDFLTKPAERRSCRYYLTSPFWRTSKLVCERLMPEAAEAWPQCLSWSNLYAAAPKEGGNPAKTLSEAQRTVCGELLKAKIEQLQPTHIVFMTDWSWFSEFNEAIPDNPVFPDMHRREDGLIVGSGRIGQAVAVVTRRVEGRCADSVYTDAVCAMFDRVAEEQA